MNPDRAIIENWLFQEFAARLAGVMETMAGARPAVSWERRIAAPTADLRWWRQTLEPLSGVVWVAAAEETCSAVERHVLGSAGIAGSQTGDKTSTWADLLGQALSGVAQALTARLNREVICPGGRPIPLDPPQAAAPSATWASVQITLGGTPATCVFGVDAPLFDSLLLSPGASAADSAARGEPDGSQTFDLLLDVELPVSVSFGRAQVPLKDLLKLTTGSIVELSRAIVEPVDILVNNRVIARGEVVVVEGNFGVRIQHVVSRQERLKSLA